MVHGYSSARERHPKKDKKVKNFDQLNWSHFYYDFPVWICIPLDVPGLDLELQPLREALKEAGRSSTGRWKFVTWKWLWHAMAQNWWTTYDIDTEIGVPLKSSIFIGLSLTKTNHFVLPPFVETSIWQIWQHWSPWYTLIIFTSFLVVQAVSPNFCIEISWPVGAPLFGSVLLNWINTDLCGDCSLEICPFAKNPYRLVIKPHLAGNLSLSFPWFSQY